MPSTITLSESDLALLRLHLERHGQVEVDDTNRELEEAGLMILGAPVSPVRRNIT